MNILVFTDFFFPDGMGGANKMAFYTSEGLARKGNRVRLITRRLRSGLPDHESIGGIEVFRYDLPRKTCISFNRTTRPQIRRILSSIGSEGGLDLLILHQPLGALEAVTHPFVREAPWIYNFHSSWGEEFLIGKSLPFARWWNPAFCLRKKARDWIEGKVLRRCGRIILLSAFMRDRLERIHRMSHKSVIIPGGVDTDTFSPAKEKVSVRRELRLPEGAVILFTVRNLRKRMGLPGLVRAMADLGAAGEKAHLVIGGKGELADELKRLASVCAVEGRIIFTGHIPEQDLPKYYQACDFFILPTEYLEGFGMVTLEALATGVPVIATPVGATPEILSQIGAEWLCEDASSRALAVRIADRVRWRTENPGAYQETAMRCRELALERYAWPLIMEQWDLECRGVIEGWRGRA